MHKQLIFVYQADSGKWNTFLDTAHKLLQPKSYSCKLCAITHGLLGEKKIWKQFRNASQIEMEFYHRDEFLKTFASKFLLKFNFPVILIAENGALEVLISAEEFTEITSVEKLIEKIEIRA